MNDIQKAFAYQDERLEEHRSRANKHLPKLAEIVNATKDSEFIAFMTEVLDDYMLNVCKLGRSE
jgi:hypothetical protein